MIFYVIVFSLLAVFVVVVGVMRMRGRRRHGYPGSDGNQASDAAGQQHASTQGMRLATGTTRQMRLEGVARQSEWNHATTAGRGSRPESGVPRGGGRNKKWQSN